MTKKNFTTLEVGGDYETPSGLVRIKERLPRGRCVGSNGVVYFSDGAALDIGDNRHDIIRRVTIKDYEPEPLDIREGCTVLLNNAVFIGPISSDPDGNWIWYCNTWRSDGRYVGLRGQKLDIVYVFPPETTAAQMAEKAEEQ
ncbi:MAG: hypothetical protein AAF556_09600, partial [Pseudomonadota bacterium]